MMTHSKPVDKPISFHFRTTIDYCEQELEKLLETIQARGGDYTHLGQGEFKLTVPSDIFWVPFHDAVVACEDRIEIFQPESEGLDALTARFSRSEAGP